MRFSFLSAAVVALAADSAVASTWFGKAAYNKWHETELERWLSDHNIPHPKPSDRKDLENLVKENWEYKIVSPYNSWDIKTLTNYITGKGEQVKKGTEKSKDSLVSQVKGSWFETEDQANGAYDSAKNWVFDTWTDSQLKSFLDKNNIPNPNPRTRDSLLSTARANYESAATTVGETAAYPGNWLWAHWSDSDLKSWLDERGIPAPQANERDQLIASVRRNSRLASLNASAAAANARSSAQATADQAVKAAKNAQDTLSDKIINGWGESQIKAWADANNINVPQGSTKNEMLALVRKHRSGLESSAQVAQKSASSVLGNAGGFAAQVTDTVYSILGNAKQAVFGAGNDASRSAYSASAQVSSSASSASAYMSSSASSASKSVAAAASSASKKGKVEL